MIGEETKGYSLPLRESERTTPLWLRIEEHLQARLARLRAKNDGALSMEQTATLRGQIAELKNLLAAGEPQD